MYIYCKVYVLDQYNTRGRETSVPQRLSNLGNAVISSKISIYIYLIILTCFRFIKFSFCDSEHFRSNLNKKQYEFKMTSLNTTVLEIVFFFSKLTVVTKFHTFIFFQTLKEAILEKITSIFFLKSAILVKKNKTKNTFLVPIASEIRYNTSSVLGSGKNHGGICEYFTVLQMVKNLDVLLASTKKKIIPTIYMHFPIGFQSLFYWVTKDHFKYPLSIPTIMEFF